jgi:hypothetical protein
MKTINTWKRNNDIILKYSLGYIFKTRICNTNYGHSKSHKSNRQNNFKLFNWHSKKPTQLRMECLICHWKLVPKSTNLPLKVLDLDANLLKLWCPKIKIHNLVASRFSFGSLAGGKMIILMSWHWEPHNIL